MITFHCKRSRSKGLNASRRPVKPQMKTITKHIPVILDDQQIEYYTYLGRHLKGLRGMGPSYM